MERQRTVEGHSLPSSFAEDPVFFLNIPEARSLATVYRNPLRLPQRKHYTSPLWNSHHQYIGHIISVPLGCAGVSY